MSDSGSESENEKGEQDDEVEDEGMRYMSLSASAISQKIYATNFVPPALVSQNILNEMVKRVLLRVI